MLGFFYSLFPQTFINIIIATIFLIIAIPIYSKKMLGGGDIKLILGIILFNPLLFTKIEFYLLFGLFACIAGITLFAINTLKHKIFKKAIIDKYNIKFAPAICVGWIIAAILIVMI